MTTRRTIIALIIFLIVLTVTPATAAATTAKPEQGPLNPAFVEALHDPLVTIGLGRLPSPVKVQVSAAVEARAARAIEPSSYSLVDEGRVTTVKDQDAYWTCWAFANIAALESTILSSQGQSVDLSEDNLIGRNGYGPFPYPYDAYTFGGWDFMAIGYLARWAGPVLEDTDPYTYPRSKAHASGPVVAHVQDVITIPGRSAWDDNDLIKQLVVENGALSVGMYWYTDYWGNDLAYDAATASYYYPSAKGENHGVCIVGWDDDYLASNFGGKWQPVHDGAFLVRNSWGASFGQEGYFWVSYDDASFAREQGLGGYGGATSYADVEDVSNYARVYQYDQLGVTDHWGFRSTRVWGANRFTAAKTQKIVAAGFYALSSSTKYEVWAGSSLRSLTKRASGTLTLPGYFTVPLTKKMTVIRGRPFVVAVKLVSPNEPHPMAVERRARSWMANAAAKRGQSFLSRNGTTWIDAASVDTTSNVCLKAFAK